MTGGNWFWFQVRLQSLLFMAALLSSIVYAEPGAPQVPEHNHFVIVARPLTIAERLQIMAQMPLIHCCVFGATYSFIVFWPFNWPNGLEQIKNYWLSMYPSFST